MKYIMVSCSPGPVISLYQSHKDQTLNHIDLVQTLTTDKLKLVTLCQEDVTWIMNCSELQWVADNLIRRTLVSSGPDNRWILYGVFLHFLVREDFLCAFLCHLRRVVGFFGLSGRRCAVSLLGRSWFGDDGVLTDHRGPISDGLSFSSNIDPLSWNHLAEPSHLHRTPSSRYSSVCPKLWCLNKNLLY